MYSNKSIGEKNTIENSKEDEITPDERVQGGKGELSFFSQCLEARNAYPVILFFEYLHFTGNSKLKTIEENRLNFINHWKDSNSGKSGNDIWSRLISMSKIGFGLSPEKAKKQLALFDKNHQTEKTEAEFYTDFLDQLKSEGFKPVKEFEELAGLSLKF